MTGITPGMPPLPTPDDVPVEETARPASDASQEKLAGEVVLVPTSAPAEAAGTFSSDVVFDELQSELTGKEISHWLEELKEIAAATRNENGNADIVCRPALVKKNWIETIVRRRCAQSQRDNNRRCR